MKKTGFALLTGLLVLSIAAGVWAAEAAPPSWKTASLTEQTATVEAIDQSTRIVTLKGPEGNSVTFKAGDEVRNLAQVHVGDQVKFAYYESIAVRVLKKDEPFPPAAEASTAARAKKGDMPAGIFGKQESVNVTITAIDKKAKTATLKGEDGSSVTVTPRDPERLNQVKVGDRLVLTFTEAVAVKVEKAGMKK